ncbi:Pycsar system effector family protein [Sediminibacterium soli]|uniref:Pycsar system effector family protein n=1 Tax=Sediminibacterium soli TaxID=2698829 RepID=UPI00137AA98B|nr:Pycsar system effector family protein [Sediminibacterium soli]NCI45896.1 HD domain-containing protein [Sediminibacterium soli]
MEPQIYKHTEDHVRELFHTMADSDLLFHNLHHTETVVQRAKEIAAHYELSEKDMQVLFIAAWFHDTGYLYMGAPRHEEKGVELAKQFLTAQGADDDMIQDVETAIMSTRYPRHPSNLVSRILCDADTYHFGTKEFKETNKKVFEELQRKEGNIDKLEWKQRAIEFLEAHEYYTPYCLNLLEEKKEANIEKMKNKTRKKEDAEHHPGEHLTLADKNLPTKGIQTMLRLTSSNHLELSEMADHKANILISVNSIIISVILGVLFRKLQDEPYLTLPSIIFLTVSVATIVIAILATRPKISEGTFTDEDVINRKTNLLFFGNFHKASFEQYNEAMRRMMRDPNYLYGSLIKDIYQLAVVLGRKYRLIRLAYNIFMFGIVISVLSFAIAIFFFKHEAVAAPAANGFPL